MPLSNMSPTSAEREKIKTEIRQNFAMATASEMLAKICEKCFRKCINRPGISLDATEQRCISMCMDRYMDSWNLVSRTYGNRLMREKIPEDS